MTTGRSVDERSFDPGWPQSLAATAAAAAATLLAYLGWLGWDQHQHRVPGTINFEGPYETWQVYGLATTLAVLAVVVTWRQLGGVAVATIPLVLTVSWSVDAADEKTIGANLWPVGAVFLAIVSLLGVLVVWGVTAVVRRVFKR